MHRHRHLQFRVSFSHLHHQSTNTRTPALTLTWNLEMEMETKAHYTILTFNLPTLICFLFFEWAAVLAVLLESTSVLSFAVDLASESRCAKYAIQNFTMFSINRLYVLQL